MNKKARISLVLLITVGLLLALTMPGLAEKPEGKGKPDTFFLTYTFTDIDWDIFYAEGTFDLETIGGTEVSGDAFVHWIPRLNNSSGGGMPVKQGTMTFIDEDTDRAVVRFSVSKIEGSYCASGHFDILYQQGTGKYENLDGGGDILMCRPDWGDTIDGRLNGWAQPRYP
jgi:hypothetical protein